MVDAVRHSGPNTKRQATLYEWLLCGCAVAISILGGTLGCVADPRETSVQSLTTPPISWTISPGREFATNSYVHKPLPRNTPVDPKSERWVAEIQRQIRTFSGVVQVNTEEYTPPIFIVGADQPTVRVANDPEWNGRKPYAGLQEQWLAVPLPDDFAPPQGEDREAVVYQPSTRRYWEFWDVRKTGRQITNSAGRAVDEWTAQWGGKIDDISTSPGYFDIPGGSYGTQATGLCFLAGIMTIEEQRAGVIDHALHFQIIQARAKTWAFPAQRTDGNTDHPDAIPEGALFRFPAELNLDAIDMDPYARMVATAIQKYGMYVSDRAGAVTLRGENPGNRYAADPYFGTNGILKCPGNFTMR